MKYLTVALNNSHLVKNFNSGEEIIDVYLKKEAIKNINHKRIACLVLADKNNEVQGFYTLSTIRIPQEDFSEDKIEKLPNKYKHLPFTLIARLSLNKDFRGKGYAKLLLLDALKRCYMASKAGVPSMAVVSVAMEKGGFEFYQSYGFITLPDSRKMFLAIDTLSKLFETK